MLPITSPKEIIAKWKQTRKTVLCQLNPLQLNASELSTAIPLYAKISYPTRGIPKCSEQSVNQNDIGLYFVSIVQLSDVEWYNLMMEVWKPFSHFNFPKTIQARKPIIWLVYSQYLDGCFCLSGILFSSKLKEHNSSKLSSLYKKLLTFWTSAKSKFNDHAQKSNMHKCSVLAMEDFRRAMEGKQHLVHYMINAVERELINENHRNLKSIVKTMIVLG